MPRGRWVRRSNQPTSTAPEQTVISGATAAVERAIALAKERGAKRAVLLQVSAPFHCSLMQPAQDALAPDPPGDTVLCPPRFRSWSTWMPRWSPTAPQLRDALVRQVTGAVRWTESMQLLIAQGVTNFVEVGPGKVLSGLLRQIDRSQKCAQVEDPASLEKLLAALALIGRKLNWGEAKRLVAALHPQEDGLLLPVHFDPDHHPGAYCFRHRDLVRLDVAPVAGVAPIHFKAAIGVLAHIAAGAAASPGRGSKWRRPSACRWLRCAAKN